MKYLAFIILAGITFVCSCAKMESRGAHYNQQVCPLCITRTGVCNDCIGSGKCTFCNGKGTRITTTANIASEDINSVSYQEKCPFCNGAGKCRYCNGNGKCWPCNGSGHVEDWNFFEKHKALTSAVNEKPEQ